MNHYIFSVLDMPDNKHFTVRGYTTNNREKLVCVWEYQTTTTGRYPICKNFYIFDGGIRAYGEPEVFYNGLLSYKDKIKTYLKSFNTNIMAMTQNFPQRPDEKNPYKL